MQGNELILSCKSCRKPVWSFNGNFSFNKVVVNHVGVLVIKELKIEHSGIYECHGISKRYREYFVARAKVVVASKCTELC